MNVGGGDASNTVLWQNECVEPVSLSVPTRAQVVFVRSTTFCERLAAIAALPLSLLGVCCCLGPGYETSSDGLANNQCNNIEWRWIVNGCAKIQRAALYGEFVVALQNFGENEDLVRAELSAEIYVKVSKARTV